jgi:hypothetical protein
MDIYKCPFSKKILKIFFKKKHTIICLKILRPFIIRFLKKGIFAFLNMFALSPP